MKNIILLIVLFLISQFAMAEVVGPADDILSNDLSFQLNGPKADETKKRKVASDKTEVTADTTKSESESDTDRELASDADGSLTNGIQFWDYQK